MHDIQKKLFELSQRRSLADLKLREIGELIGVTHPQLIKHHLSQLVKRGLLAPDYVSVKAGSPSQELINIPVLGSANCGEPTMLAAENLEGYLKVSPSLLDTSQYSELFALKAMGDSMNKAKIRKLYSINDGDYVIVNKSATQPDNGDYVVSIIDGAANIKKFIFDNQSRLVYLLSESTKSYPPIIIKPEDEFMVNGKVIGVIKIPREVV